MENKGWFEEPEVSFNNCLVALKGQSIESPNIGMGIVCVSVLFSIVFDHLTSTFAPWSVSTISPRARCLEGSKAAMECGSMLEICRSVKNANEYKAVNCMGIFDVCVTKRIS